MKKEKLWWLNILLKFTKIRRKKRKPVTQFFQFSLNDNKVSWRSVTYVLHNQEFKNIYMSTISFVSFKKIQMQAFQALYMFVESMFIEVPTGSGKTVYAEFALLR